MLSAKLINVKIQHCFKDPYLTDCHCSCTHEPIILIKAYLNVCSQQIWIKLTGLMIPSLYFISDIKILSFITYTLKILFLYSLLEGYQSLPRQQALKVIKILQPNLQLKLLKRGIQAQENKEVHSFALHLCFILCRFNMTSVTLVQQFSTFLML